MTLHVNPEWKLEQLKVIFLESVEESFSSLLALMFVPSLPEALLDLMTKFSYHQVASEKLIPHACVYSFLH